MFGITKGWHVIKQCYKNDSAHQLWSMLYIAKLEQLVNEITAENIFSV